MKMKNLFKLLNLFFDIIICFHHLVPKFLLYIIETISFPYEQIFKFSYKIEFRM